MLTFSPGGPVDPVKHYQVPPLDRIDFDLWKRHFEAGDYFLFKAPRRFGKTTVLTAVADALNEAGQYHALYLPLHGAAAMGSRLDAALEVVCEEIILRGGLLFDDSFLTEWAANAARPLSLRALLQSWCGRLGKPLVLLVDGIDGLRPEAVRFFLAQIAAGYDLRSKAFPRSVVLAGAHDLCLEVGEVPGFRDIFCHTLYLGPFTFTQIKKLYAEHTKKTRQKFTDEALDLIAELTDGHPWLVNALGAEVGFESALNGPREPLVSEETIAEAKDHWLRRRTPYASFFSELFEEPGVRPVLEPMLFGGRYRNFIEPRFFERVVELGLFQMVDGPVIANRLFKEILANEPVEAAKHYFQENVGRFVDPHSLLLQMKPLIASFRHLYEDWGRQWVAKCGYPEAGPVMLFTAYLQYLLKGKGRVELEFGLGRGHVDLFVFWQTPDDVQCWVLCLKRREFGLMADMDAVLQAVVQNMDMVGTAHGAGLLFFDGERTADGGFEKHEECRGRKVMLFGV